jgi:hypothetical protein
MFAKLIHILMLTLQGCTVMKISQIPLLVRVSRTGFIIIFTECPVFWQSKLQTETALSTIEAKFIALSACCRELFPIIDMVCLLAEATNLPIGNTTMNVSIHKDNLGALVLAKTLLCNQVNLVS